MTASNSKGESDMNSHKHCSDCGCELTEQDKARIKLRKELMAFICKWADGDDIGLPVEVGLTEFVYICLQSATSRKSAALLLSRALVGASYLLDEEEIDEAEQQ